ncbi:hypothetical protein GIB67_024798, partial [Kingdonia uniflora]
MNESESVVIDVGVEEEEDRQWSFRQVVAYRKYYGDPEIINISKRCLASFNGFDICLSCIVGMGVDHGMILYWFYSVAHIQVVTDLWNLHSSFQIQGMGKTFTMRGTHENRRVNYKTLEQVFRMTNERSTTPRYELFVSMLEVYNEKIRDLLVESSYHLKKNHDLRGYKINVAMAEKSAPRDPSFFGH